MLTLDHALTPILRVLAECSAGGGFLTKQVAERTPMFGHNRRIHSGATRSWLMELQRAGYVEPMDAEKPTVWRITEAGRRALMSDGAPSRDGGDSSTPGTDGGRADGL